MQNGLIVRAALVCGAAGLICGIWTLTDDTAAHAADRSDNPLPVVDLASDLADTVEQLPHRPTALIPDGPALEPLNRVRRTARQLRTAAADTAPQLEAAPTPPRTPTAPPPADEPEPEEVSAVALLVGSAPSTVTVDLTQADSIALAALLCGDLADDPAPPSAGDTPAHSGTPCTPDGPAGAGGLTAMKPPTQTGVDMFAATIPSGPAAPALRFLGELLPRSDLPTGRTEHPEPGPA